jgi:hypothetical protein
VFLNELLRPAALMAVRAACVAPELETFQRRLESWNLMLSAIAGSGSLPAPMAALGQRLRMDRPTPYALD